MTPRLVIVGCGAVLENLHRPAINRLRRKGALEVAAVVDPVEGLRERAASWFPGAAAYPTLTEAVQSRQPTGVLVLCPPATHAAVLEEALQFDLDVFSEKPLTGRFDEARSLMSHDGHERISVGMVRRQFDTSEILRTRMASLVDTTDFRIRTAEGAPYHWPVVSDRAFRREFGGVGIILESGIHALDLLVWLFGAASVTSLRTDETPELVARNAELDLEFSGGVASVALSWTDLLPPGLRIDSRLGSIWVSPGGWPDVFQRQKGGAEWVKLHAPRPNRDDRVRYQRARCRTIYSAATLQLVDFVGPTMGRLATAAEATEVLAMLDGVAPAPLS